jgi:hypothetical protein
LSGWSEGWRLGGCELADFFGEWLRRFFRDIVDSWGGVGSWDFGHETGAACGLRLFAPLLLESYLLRVTYSPLF